MMVVSWPDASVGKIDLILDARGSREVLKPPSWSDGAFLALKAL